MTKPRPRPCPICAVAIEPQRFMCRTHWFLVPEELRATIDRWWNRLRAAVRADYRAAAGEREAADRARALVWRTLLARQSERLTPGMRLPSRAGRPATARACTSNRQAAYQCNDNYFRPGVRVHAPALRTRGKVVQRPPLP